MSKLSIVPRKWFEGLTKDELLTALFVGLSSGFLLFGYEFVRASSNTLFKLAYGVQNFPVIMALVTVGLIVTLNIYGRLITKTRPRATLLITILGSAGIILLCYLGIRAGIKAASGALYIYREIYCVLVIEQYWSFNVSTFKRKTAARINGPLLALSSVGGILGGLTVHNWAEHVGTEKLLFFAMASLFPCALFAALAFWIGGEPASAHSKVKSEDKDQLGLKEFKREPVLIWIFLLIIFTQVVSTTLNLEIQNQADSQFVGVPDRETAFWGNFYFWVNSGAALSQLILAPLFNIYLKTASILLLIPMVHMMTTGWLSISGGLAAVSFSFWLFKVMDYSIFRASKELLYMPLSFDVRYRAKEVIDVFGYRIGKGGTATLIVLFQKIGFKVDSFYGPIAFVAALGWLVSASRIRGFQIKKDSV